MKITILAVAIVIIVIFIFVVRMGVVFRERLKFYSKGREHGFRNAELSLIWRSTEKCGIIDPLSIYTSVSNLNRVIALILSEHRRSAKADKPAEQVLINKLNKMRAKIAVEADVGEHIKTSRALEPGQKITVLFYGRGVFSSYVVDNDTKLIVELPKKRAKVHSSANFIPPGMWKGRRVSVYFWRKSDACYAFDTIVENYGTVLGKQCIYLQHADRLDRAQKRKSVRHECMVNATMFVQKSVSYDYNAVENDADGLKCMIEDISEDGALIRIGGKGKGNIRVKLQFHLNSVFIMMFGVIHTVEYNRNMNQSRLHFECTNINEEMKNSLLTYIYNQVPDEDRERDMAIRATESENTESENEGAEGEEENDSFSL